MSINHNLVLPKKGNSVAIDRPLKSPKMIIIYGARGSGKSVLLLNLLMLINKENKEIEDALFVTGSNRDPLLEALDEMEVTDKASDLSDFMLKVKNNTDGKNVYVLALDDLTGSPDFKIFFGRSQFTHFVLSARHYKTYILFTTQTYSNSVSDVVKQNASMWFIFEPKSKVEREKLLSVADNPETMDKALKLLHMRNLDLTAKGQFPTWLYVNKDSSKTRYFIGFDEELKEI